MDSYTKSSNDVIESLNSRIEGLNQEEVSIRLEKYGYNEIKEKKKKTIFSMIVAMNLKIE